MQIFHLKIGLSQHYSYEINNFLFEARLIFDTYNIKCNIFALSMHKFMQLFSLKIKVAVFSIRGKFGFPLIRLDFG